jgi:hypothetical protein
MSSYEPAVISEVTSTKAEEPTWLAAITQWHLAKVIAEQLPVKT